MQVTIDCEILKNKETGVERYTKKLIRQLDSQVDLTLLHNSYVTHPFFAQYKTLCLKRKDFPLARSIYAACLPPRIETGILHAPTPVPPIWRKPKCKLIITVHDLTPLIFPEYHNWKRKVFFRWLLNHIMRISDAIIADSQATKKDIISYFAVPGEKIDVVHLATDIRPKYGQLPDKYGIENDYILYVGTVEPRKNLMRLIDAYNQLKPDEKLVIVGASGWHNKTIYQRRNPNIIFAGYVPEEDLPLLYTNAKLFIYPSLYEGFGIPILEAMTCRCPVITSTISSMPEVAGNAALLVDPYRVDDIKAAMTKVMEDENLRKQMITAGVEQANRFSWEKVAAETIAVYQRVLRSTATPF